MAEPMDVDFMMHNPPPEPSTPRSHQSHQSSGCPYMRGEHTSNPLPHPNPNLNLAAFSPIRNPYDPVHPSNAPWLSQQSPGYQWTHPAIPAQPPVHQPRLSMGDQYYGSVNGGPGHLSGPMPGMIPNPSLNGIHDPFGPLSWSYRHSQNSQRPERLGENVQRYGGPPPLQPSQPGSHHQTNSLERIMTNSAPRSLPVLNLAQTQPPPPPSNMSNSADSSPSSTGRPSFTAIDSPTRAPNRATFSMSIPHPPSTTASPPANPHIGPRSIPSYNMPRQDQTVPMPTPPVPPNTERRRAVAGGRRRSVSRLHAQISDGDSEEDFDSLDEDQQTLRFMEQFHAGAAPYPVRMADMSEDRIRAHQLLRGAMSNRRVASRSAISSLQSVEISSLPENERMCIICYNDFGSPTPEGINEAPLRLPKCKHVFGDHCIKKWFEESDSCPYCRDKVPSEPQVRANPTVVHTFLRAQQVQRMAGRPSASASSGGSGSPAFGVLSHTDAYMRIMQASREAREELASTPPRAWQPGERRSPPDELGENRRRTRPRHGSFRGSPPSSIANGNSNPRPNSFAGASSNTLPQSQPQNPFPQASHMSQFMQGAPAQPPMPPMSHFHLPGMQSMGAESSQQQIPPHSHPPNSFAPPPMSLGQENTLFSNPLNNGPVPLLNNGPPFPQGSSAATAFSQHLPPVGGLDGAFPSIGGPAGNPPISNRENWPQ